MRSAPSRASLSISALRRAAGQRIVGAPSRRIAAPCASAAISPSLAGKMSGSSSGGLAKKKRSQKSLYSRPLLVDLEIDQRRLDLDDPDLALRPEPQHVGAPAVGERHFGEAAEIALVAQEPHHPALHPERRRRLPQIDDRRRDRASGRRAPERGPARQPWDVTGSGSDSTAIGRAGRARITSSAATTSGRHDDVGEADVASPAPRSRAAAARGRRRRTSSARAPRR